MSILFPQWDFNYWGEHVYIAMLTGIILLTEINWDYDMDK